MYMYNQQIRKTTMEGLEGVTRVPTVIFRKDRHLASALVISEIQYMMTHRTNPKALKREHTQLLDDLSNRHIIHPQYAYSWFMDNTTRLYTHNHTPELNSLLAIATRVMEISLEDYTNIKATYPVSTVPLLSAIYNIKTEFDNLFDTIVYSSEFKQPWRLGGLKGCAYGNLHMIDITATEALIITHSHLAGIRDMFNSWFDVLLYAHINKSKYEGFDLYQEHASSVLKSWPSLAIASTLRCQEQDTRFLDSLEKDLAPITHTDLYKWLTRPLPTTAAVHLQLEMSGLWKCFGHPIIDMDLSVKNWIQTGAILKTDLEQAGQRIKRMFCMTFCKNFFKEKRNWPPLSYSRHTSRRVIDNIKSNTWNEDPRYPWTSQEFQGIELKECLTFDMHVDVTDLLSDKSIIPSRSQWIHEYDKQVHRTLYGRFPTGPPSTTKSAVISYLEKEEVNVKEIIDTN
ncbi:unnamed protein product [Ceutorhynchus assimilis]|uniref:RdRp catalytic domain-containing protein n=1 Tax=Ceutorhynchus assimilis TaxID=467358 RepID=A0A9N9MG51_9CUCU|nr:unnamed protein product [Ceutorhynchus assimilis]